ncbi:hypothetical protein B9Q11_02250 [Candidatus Marsarchaeota G2 archaeon ECH_B_SAG-F08]|uniref:Uncharacterized protein n=1 Tax=Candidatus Marsarchaeota G2 archaeon ECH_B_SAG-F08 TaxID=1978165 RepID=A0A2R6BIG3_9ARCH|nr:MAG: hypothetical protein B9Q11_02250 [Candidatus Marsarchaeota G2 archaeon ECH_B_SAG-F08]
MRLKRLKVFSSKNSAKNYRIKRVFVNFGFRKVGEFWRFKKPPSDFVAPFSFGCKANRALCAHSAGGKCRVS